MTIVRHAHGSIWTRHHGSGNPPPVIPAWILRTRGAGPLSVVTEDYFGDGSRWGTRRPRGWGGFWLRVSRGFGFTLKILGSWLSSRFALLGRRIARPRLSGPVDTVVWGLRLRLFPNRSISEARILFLPAHWDHHERMFLKRSVKPDFTFVDIGANVGGYSFWVASLMGAQGRIVAVEPDPALVRQMRYNVAVNRAEGRIHIVEAAVAASPGRGHLIRNRLNSGENRLARRNIPDHTGDDEVVPVRVTTLRSVVEREGLEHIDCLKVDVEGHEREVLAPFFASVSRSLWPRALIVEMKDDPTSDSAAMGAWIAARGYRLERRTRRNGLFRLEEPGSPGAAP